MPPTSPSPVSRSARDAAIGDPENALALIERVVDEARTAMCAEAVGAMDESLKTTVEYIKTRKQFGVAIGTFQALQHRASDMFVALEQARSMSMFATMAADFDDAKERARAVAAAKVQIGKSGKFVGQQSIQLHGGIGMTQEAKIGHYFKRLTMIENTLRRHRLSSAPRHRRRRADLGHAVTTRALVMPREAGHPRIPESSSYHDCRGVLDRPVKPGDDDGVCDNAEDNNEKHPVRSHRPGRRRHRLEPRHRQVLGGIAGEARRQSRDLLAQGGCLSRGRRRHQEIRRRRACHCLQHLAP